MKSQQSQLRTQDHQLLKYNETILYIKIKYLQNTRYPTDDH